MPVTYLREQRRAVLNGVTQGGLFIGGQKVWKAPTANPLLAHYGTGLGQIPLHHRLSDHATVTSSGGLVSAVSNQGGAGSYFDASASGTGRPALVTSGLSFDGSDLLSLANGADIVGVHMAAAVWINAGITDARLMGGPGGYVRMLPSSNNNSIRVQVQIGGTSISSTALSTPASAWDRWHIVEMRFTGAHVKGWINGSQLIDQALTKASPQLINTIGKHQTTYYTGRVGDIWSCIISDLTVDEPAVLAGRRYLYDLYGVPL